MTCHCVGSSQHRKLITDFAPEIGWNLAIGYLKDNKRKQAKATLEKLIEVAPEGTAIGNKARELLNQI